MIPLPGCQWQVKVYRGPLLKTVIILVVTVTGSGGSPSTNTQPRFLTTYYLYHGVVGSSWYSCSVRHLIFLFFLNSSFLGLINFPEALQIVTFQLFFRNIRQFHRLWSTRRPPRSQPAVFWSKHSSFMLRIGGLLCYMSNVPALLHYTKS